MKQQFLIKFFSIGVLALVFTVAPIQMQIAEAAWGELLIPQMNNTFAILRDQVRGMIMGAQKQAAIQGINARINAIIGGSSPQNSLIITNYRDFLDIGPSQKTNIYMNDYLSQITQGRGSSSGYIPAEGFGDGAFVNSYRSQLVQSALSVTADRTQLEPTYNGNPSQNMFSEGNLNNFNLYLSGINNPWAFNLNAQQKYQERLAIEQDAARTEAIAGRGIKSTKQGDTIITPGSVTSDILAKTQTIGLDVIANAQSVPEIITAVVNSLLSKALQNGIGNAQGNAQRADAWKNTDKQTTAGSAGPAAAWKNPDLVN